MTDAGTDERMLRDWPHVHRAGSDTVLLMLHGTGGDEQEILALADALDPSASVLAPRGRVLEGGMRRWFRRLSEGVFDVDDVVDRAAELAEFVRAARRAYGLGGGPLTAVGFSNGANIGSALGIRHPDVTSRVIAFSGMYPFADAELDQRLDDSRFLLLNGSSDPMAPSASVDRLASELARVGATVERRTRPGGHGIAAEELEIAKGFLAG